VYPAEREEVTVMSQQGRVVDRTVTDTRGRYLFSLPAGTYTVSVSAFAGTRSTVRLGRGQLVEIDLTMSSSYA
jgi:hypothetical protein